MFASAVNAQLPRYCSRWYAPGGVAVDALNLSDQQWRVERSWVNPPWCILEAVVEKLRSSGGAATVVAPTWVSAIWHQQLLDMAAEVRYPRCATSTSRASTGPSARWAPQHGAP